MQRKTLAHSWGPDSRLYIRLNTDRNGKPQTNSDQKDSGAAGDSTVNAWQVVQVVAAIVLPLGTITYLPPEDQHETYKYLDLCIEANREHDVCISGALYPDGSYFGPTNSVYGVEPSTGSVGVVESPSLHPFATRGGCERISGIGQRSARR